MQLKAVEEQPGPVAKAHIGHDVDAAVAVFRDHLFARLLRHLLGRIGGEIAEQVEAGDPLFRVLLEMGSIIRAAKTGLLAERQMRRQGRYTLFLRRNAAGMASTNSSERSGNFIGALTRSCNRLRLSHSRERPSASGEADHRRHDLKTPS